MSERTQPYRVTVFHNKQAIESLTFDRNVITIGRDSECELQIDDITISRQQAELLRTSQGFALYAHQTQNLTCVRGEAVPAGETVSLSPGDPIRLAEAFDIKLELVEQAAAPKAPRRRSAQFDRPTRRLAGPPTPKQTPLGPARSNPGRPGPARPPEKTAGPPRRPRPTRRQPRRTTRTHREPPPAGPNTRRLRPLPPRPPGTVPTPRPPASPLTPRPPATARTPKPPAVPLPPEPAGTVLLPNPPTSFTPEPPGIPLPPKAPETALPPEPAGTVLLSNPPTSFTPDAPGVPIPAKAPVAAEIPSGSFALGATPGASIPVPSPVEVIPSARRRDGQPRAWILCRLNDSEQALGIHDDFYIGGGEDSDLRLNGAYAPRRAALIVCVDGSHRIYNTSPLPETVIVNGRGIQGFADLVDGDKIQVYGAALTFEKNPGLIP